MKDDVVAKLIAAEEERQKNVLEMIPSENYVSQDVLTALGSVFTNKYSEGYPGRRYYGGQENTDQIEQLAIDRAKQLFGADHANVQPHSGAQANEAVYYAWCDPGDTILAMDLGHGGHLTHGSPVNFSGIMYRPVAYSVREDDERVDYDQLESLARSERPKMIIGGASAYSRDWDYARIRRIADEVGAIFLVDMAHPAGLIAAGKLDNPVKYAHVVTSTTHKTLRGPRGGIILMGKDFENPWGVKTARGETRMMSAIFDSAVFPGMQGGPLQHVIAAKAVAFHEALQPDYKLYQTQVKKNAAALASAFMDKGYKVVSNGTDNHIVLVDLRRKFPNLTGRVAEDLLVAVNITTNKNMVPFDDRSPFQTSGLRFGSAAITTRGAKEELMGEVVEMIDHVLSNPEDDKVVRSVKEQVNRTMKGYPLFAW